MNMLASKYQDLRASSDMRIYARKGLTNGSPWPRQSRLFGGLSLDSINQYADAFIEAQHRQRVHGNFDVPNDL